MKKEKYDQYIDKQTEFYYYILKSEDMIRLTYQDYFEYVKKRENNWTLEEETEDYQITKYISYDNEHDKVYKTVLSNKEMACYVINEVLDLREQEKIEKLIRKIEEGNDMLRVEKMIIAENKRIRKEGKKEGKKEIVKVMKSKGLEIKLIEEITGFTEEEILKMK